MYDPLTMVFHKVPVLALPCLRGSMAAPHLRNVLLGYLQALQYKIRGSKHLITKSSRMPRCNTVPSSVASFPEHTGVLSDYCTISCSLINPCFSHLCQIELKAQVSTKKPNKFNVMHF